MSFILNPPVVLKNGVGFSIIQAGHMTLAESLVINMADWSALDLLHHWHSEINECLAGHRNKCCIVTGLVTSNGKVMPSEWWTAYFVEGQVRLHYQVLSVASSDNWASPDEWWKNILQHDHKVSEWIISPKELMDWRNQCDVLFAAVDALNDD